MEFMACPDTLALRVSIMKNLVYKIINIKELLAEADVITYAVQFITTFIFALQITPYRP